MLTILSTLISFLMGGLPKLLDFFKDRGDKRHELGLAQLQIQRELEMRKLGYEAQERVEHIHTEQLAMETSAAKDIAVIGAQQAAELAREHLVDAAVGPHIAGIQVGQVQPVVKHRPEHAVAVAQVVAVVFLLGEIDCGQGQRARLLHVRPLGCCQLT